MNAPDHIAPDSENRLRRRLREIVFDADDPAGKAFDVALIVAILASVAAVAIDSVEDYRLRWGEWLVKIEWAFTIVFSVEYVLRLWTVREPLRYASSFYGVVDFVSVAPTYLGLLFPGGRFLLVVRLLRVLRVFRVLKFVQLLGELNYLVAALRASRKKIFVFVFAVFTLVVVLGSLMYMIEGAENGFTSIPKSAYWAIVTLTTVGYGDISPQTPLGQTLASIIMILGYGIIAVPTGIVTVEMQSVSRKRDAARKCPGCGAEGHDHDARHCKRCGAKLEAGG
jgi:voltage-gated potassium channel